MADKKKIVLLVALNNHTRDGGGTRTIRANTPDEAVEEFNKDVDYLITGGPCGTGDLMRFAVAEPRHIIENGANENAGK